MTKLEYIWIDRTEDAPQLRSKTKTKNRDREGIIYLQITQVK